MPSFLMTILTCQGRQATLKQTLESLSQTDWNDTPLVFRDPHQLEDPKESQTRASFDLLTNALILPWDFLLFCEDDVLFNRHLHHNLSRWSVLNRLKVGSLYCHDSGVGDFVELPAQSLGGSQAIVISREWLPKVLKQWDEHHPSLMQDLRIYRTVEMIFGHCPSLIQHRAGKSTWGGPHHSTMTFDAEYRSGPLTKSVGPTSKENSQAT